MRPLDLALKYMEIVFSGNNLNDLIHLLACDFNFRGPLFEFDSAEGYIHSLKSEPPLGFKYKIINSFENESSACLVYEFLKPNVCVSMAQLFEIKDSKISSILLTLFKGTIDFKNQGGQRWSALDYLSTRDREQVRPHPFFRGHGNDCLLGRGIHLD